MSNPSYNSTKVQQFLNAMATYKDEKNNYMNALTTFNSQINTLTESHKAAKTTTNPDFNPQYKDDMTYNSFLTSEGVVVYKDGSTASGDGFQENALNSSKQYVSDLHMSDVSYSGKVSNVVVQMGLDDLAFNNDNAVNEVYQIPTTSTAVIDNTPGSSTKGSLPTQTCDVNFLYACDSNAKQNDMPYYGVADATGDSCQCYTFTDTPSTIVQPSVKRGTIDTINSKDIKDIPGGISYLGILFDGALYALTQTSYSDNYDNVYDTSTTSNLIEIDTTHQNTNCNPFSGSGVNRITFNSLGEDQCEMK